MAKAAKLLIDIDGYYSRSACIFGSEAVSLLL